MSKHAATEISIIKTESVPVEDFVRPGAAGVKLQNLIGERQGSERVAMRLYTVQKGGHTNIDQHEYEHQMYVLKGHGILKCKNKDLPLSPGDAVLVPANIQHQFINQDEAPFIYLLINIS